MAVSLPSFAQVGQPGTIAGTVSAPGRSPVSSAAILLTGPDGFTRHGSTGADGSFALRQIPSGSDYRVSITAPGFAPAEQAGVSVAVGRTTQLALTLARSPHPQPAEFSFRSIMSSEPSHP